MASLRQASSAVGQTRSTNASTSSRGKTPVNSSASWPSTKAFTAGMLRMAAALESSLFSSVFTFTSRTAPPFFSTACSSSGARVLHGAHHGAQKSTITGTSAERSSTSAWKVSVVASVMYSGWLMGHLLSGATLTILPSVASLALRYNGAP